MHPPAPPPRTLGPWRHLSALGTALSLALLAGCTPTPTHTPTPTPEPSPTCTPIFNGDIGPCTQDDYNALETKRAQYAEAEKTYRESLSLLWSLGGAKELATPALTSTATDEYLESITGSLETYRADAGLEISGAQEIKWMKPADLIHGDADFAMTACIAPGTLSIVVNGEPTSDTWFSNHVFFRMSDKDILITYSQATETDSC